MDHRRTVVKLRSERPVAAAVAATTAASTAPAARGPAAASQTSKTVIAPKAAKPPRAIRFAAEIAQQSAAAAMCAMETPALRVAPATSRCVASLAWTPAPARRTAVAVHRRWEHINRASAAAQPAIPASATAMVSLVTAAKSTPPTTRRAVVTASRPASQARCARLRSVSALPPPPKIVAPRVAPAVERATAVTQTCARPTAAQAVGAASSLLAAAAVRCAARAPAALPAAIAATALAESCAAVANAWLGASPRRACAAALASTPRATRSTVAGAVYRVAMVGRAALASVALSG